MRSKGDKQTHRVLQLCVLLLGVDEVEDDVERAGEDQGEEQAEAGEIRVPLGAAIDTSEASTYASWMEHALELARSHVGLCANVLGPRPGRLGEVRLRGDPPHPLDCVNKQDCYESTQRG